MTISLFYSPNSPYARKCRVVALEKGLEEKVEFIKVDPYALPVELVAVNPLSRVPALQTEEGVHITESALISEFLDNLPSKAKPLLPDSMQAKLNTLALMGLSEGLMDAAVETVMQSRRERAKQWADLIERRHQAILRTIDIIAKHNFTGDAMLNMGTLSLACALAYTHFRMPHLQWEHTYPALDTWLGHVLKRPSFMQTMPEA